MALHTGVSGDGDVVNEPAIKKPFQDNKALRVGG